MVVYLSSPDRGHTFPTKLTLTQFITLSNVQFSLKMKKPPAPHWDGNPLAKADRTHAMAFPLVLSSDELDPGTRARLCRVNRLAQSLEEVCTGLPEQSAWRLVRALLIGRHERSDWSEASDVAGCEK